MFQNPNNNAVHPTFSAQTADRRPRALISLTPLIDVVFILLLFFMLASSFLDLNTIMLDAPSEGSQTSSSQGALLIQVQLDGVRFAGRYMPLSELTDVVAKRLEKHPDLRVLVQPGAGVNLQRTVRILDQLSTTGAAHLSLMQSPGYHVLAPDAAE